MSRLATLHRPPHPHHHRARTPLLDTAVTLAEDLRGMARAEVQAHDGFSADFQICLPYRGLFVWHVGRDEVVGDANQLLFVTGGEPFRLSVPASPGYAELILTPREDTLEALAGVPLARLAAHPLFRRRSRQADAAVQRLGAALLRGGTAGPDVLEREETAIALMRAALAPAAADPPAPNGRTRRLIARAKAFLDAHLSAPLTLQDVGRAAGASPAHLTHVFRRFEGVPLHRYLVHLRLARALTEVPHAGDLTALALDLGFCSHSHFTAAFRRRFQCTPSAFRASTRARRQHIVAATRPASPAHIA